MNHPSIGGKEQEPQSSDVPKELLFALDTHLKAFYGGDVRAWDAHWLLTGIPPGWMKTEQGWVQMERAGAHHTRACLDSADPSSGYDGDGFYVGEDERCICAPGIPIYRVKQPPEDHPAGP